MLYLLSSIHLHGVVLNLKKKHKDTFTLSSYNSTSAVYGCIHVAQDRDQWRALEITVMNLRVP